MTRPAVSPAATYPDEIWDTLKAVTHFTPPTVISEGVRGRYQLLEVLVTRIMSLLQPEYTWTVTRVSKDHGMDFVGRRVLFEIPDLDFRSVDVVTGQCKRVRSIQSLGRALSYDVVRMVPGAQPSHIVLVVAGRATSALRKKTVEEFTAAFQRPVTYLGIEELDYFVRRYLRELQPLIEEALGGGAAAVIEHFSGPGSVAGTPLGAEPRSPEIGETGKPFEVTVQLHSRGVPLDDLRVRWEWGSGGGRDDAPALLRLVRPLQLARPEGMAFGPGERLAVCLRLKLVGYHPGRQALGTLVFTEASGAEIHRQPLGEIDLADQYHPPFFRTPFEPFFREFAGLWEQARSGHTHAIAVTGAGGAGKTRFCQELGFHAEQEGGRYVFSSHPNNLDDPYQIFGGLMRVLVAEPLSLDDPGTVVLRHLRARAPELAERIEPTLSLLYRDGRSPQAAFDRGALVQALCLLLVDAARQQPLMVHVSDCHWAQRPGLDLFRDVRDRLADLPDPRLRRVAFVFEGRSRESLALGPDGGDGTVAWETFVAQAARPVLEVPVLSREQSEAFLVSLFESTQSAERSVPEELVPLQDVLVEEIRRHGEGNPFHMVEQLRLLRHQGMVACNQRTGLLYLAGHPNERHAVPHDVRELIHLRVDYLRRRHPAARVLLAACAFILDRVPRALYDHLRERLAPGVPEAEILGTGFLQPSDEMLGEVRFRHENYYEVMRGLEVSAADRERIGSAYFEWMDARGGSSAQALLERALVMARMPAPPAPAIRSLLTEALEKADAAHQYVLSRRVAEHLLPVVREAYRESGAAEDLLESIRVERRLTHLLGMTGSWLERERMLRTLVRRMRDMLADPQVQGNAALRLEVDYHLHASLVSQANVWIDTLEHHEAIRLMEGALPDLEARLRAARDSGDPRTADWARLYVQGKNRLAVARWFDGRHAASRRLFRTGFRECRSLSDHLYEFHNLLDYATLCIHRDPRRASVLLGECLAMLDRLEGGGILPRHRYLAQFQRVIAELLATARGRGDLAARARELAADAQAVHVNALREGYVHEQGGASLVAGVCCAIGEEAEAARWLMHSIRVSHTSHLLEFLWKAHLNLGQLCLELPPQAREGAGQHAEAAQRILTTDLERRSREDDRRHRRALYLLPLAQLARVWDALGDARGGGVRAEFPEVRVFFGPGGALRPDRHRPGQVLHATRGESDYFLLS